MRSNVRHRPVLSGVQVARKTDNPGTATASVVRNADEKVYLLVPLHIAAADQLNPVLGEPAYQPQRGETVSN